MHFEQVTMEGINLLSHYTMMYIKLTGYEKGVQNVTLFSNRSVVFILLDHNGTFCCFSTCLENCRVLKWFQAQKLPEFYLQR